MENSTFYSGANIIKLSDKSLEELLEPIPEEILIEKVAQINGWKTKRQPLMENQSKREYFHKYIGKNLTLGIFREFRVLREQSLIPLLKWNIYSWDKSIARFYPDKIEAKIESVIYELSSLVNLDLLLVDEESQTLFILLEMWQKEIVADTFLSKVETNIPKYFRAYISIKNKMLLIEEKSEQATENFIKIFEKAFSVITNEIRVNAMIVREFVKQSKEKITRLVVKVPQEIAGFGGLTELTLLGSDVLIGARGLMNRHETSPIDVGPWAGVSNPYIDINVGKSIRVEDIHHALWLYQIMKNL
ncbi:MAG: hypothetical protein ACFFDW_04065 [Candidatus Thorarchaeota archaeon]